MNKIKSRFFALIFIMIATLAYGQSIQVKLQWQKNIVVQEEDHSFEILNFDGAEFPGEIPSIPVYIKVVDIKPDKVYSDYQIILKNIKTKVCTQSEINTIRNKNNIPDSYIPVSKVEKAREEFKLYIELNPFIKNKKGNIEKLISFDLMYKGIASKSGFKNTKRKWADNSVLNTGTWVRIPITKSGIYSLSYTELRAMGLNPENVRVFGNDIGLLSMKVNATDPDDLLENDVLIADSKIIFYAQGPDKWYYDETDESFRHTDHYYSDVVYYYFSSDYNSSYNNNAEQINSLSTNPDYTVTDFTDYARINDDIVNLAHTGRIFYGDIFDIELAKQYNFDFPNLKTNKAAKVRVRVAATCTSTSYFRISSGNYSGNIAVNAFGDHSVADTGFKKFETNPVQSNKFSINLEYGQNSPSWKGWLDYIAVNVVRNLRWTGEQMQFRNIDCYGSGKVSEFIISNAQTGLQVWDVTDPIHPKIINAELVSGNLKFTVATDELREFLVCKSGDYYSLSSSDSQNVENQNIHAVSPTTDMIIVTHPLFYTQAEALKTLREENDGLEVYITTPEKIYNEFSCGAPDISAIRNFAKMVYDKASEPEDALKYLLLFGDASYETKAVFEENTNFILCYQSTNSEGDTGSYFSDDFFGLLDIDEGDNVGSKGSNLTGAIDIGIGRIPVATAGQATDYLNKLKGYANSTTNGAWRNNLVFVADDENQNAHIRDADTLAINIDRDYPWFNIKKIYLDAYRQETIAGGERYPEASKDINNSVMQGNLLINYTGHGSPKGWAHERVLSISNIENWSNSPKFPLFVTATCEFTPLDNYNYLSAGERIFLKPNGGAIALFTTARVAYIGTNATLTKKFYSKVFELDEHGNKLRLGDISRYTKNSVGNYSKSIFFLLGDPSLELGYAEHNITTTSINENPITGYNDTIKALSKVSFSGEVQDRNGNLIEDFSGKVFPVVYDKKQEIKTLNNDGHGVWIYEDRTNIIYKGQSTAKNGKFDFEFIVPRDIFLNVDSGKVTYYGMDGNITAKGAFEEFLVGGISDDYPEDNTGPEITLYMNDENFVTGGTTDNNPLLLAKFSDESGINTAGGAIGHDITAVLDDNTQDIISLNSDYIADSDTYQSGKAEHFLFDIEEGEHKMKLKAWDVYNNSSEQVLDFIVVNSDELELKHLLNYPNPFTTSTDFYFEHNKVFERLDVLIQIFTVSGKLVKTIQETTDTQGYRAGPYHWNGTDDFGQRIGRGAYVYRVKIRTSLGEVKEDYQKLLILK